MVEFARVHLDFEPYLGPVPTGRPSQVFAKDRAGTGFPAQFGKNTKPKDPKRQDWFEAQLGRISLALGKHELPVFIEWNGGVRNRMDKGCVGHSIARNFLMPIASSATGVRVMTVCVRQ